MGIGYLLLYGALALVALWLTAELLLQHRAPLHWRALALLGFLGVVAGMRTSSLPVIAAGAAAFALGQVRVTGSVKRGRPVGWSLRRPDGALPGPLAKVPLLAAASGAPAAAVAAPEPVVPVGEVGPIEDEPFEPFDPLHGRSVDHSADYEEFQQLDAGVYADDPGAYQVPPQPQYGQAQQGYGYQQQDPGHGYGYQDQWAAQQQYQPQPQYQSQPQQSQQQQPQWQLIGYDQYGQPVYQDPYTQQQYQQPHIPQQAQPQQQPQDQNWYYQQQY